MRSLNLVGGAAAIPGGEYWEARIDTRRGTIHVGSIHDADGLWVPVCRAGHRLPGSVEISTAAADLQHHLADGCKRTAPTS
jgi:hypothetical protein